MGSKMVTRLALAFLVLPTRPVMRQRRVSSAMAGSSLDLLIFAGFG
jgi:hypothetical protein